MTPDKKRPVIYVDNREASSNVGLHLRKLEARVEHKQLEVGDYICSSRVALERKSIPDFLQSIINQRVFTQLENLSNSYENPVLILEGNPELLFLERDMNANTIRGVLASIAIDYRIPIMWTRNSKETAAQIYWIAKREQIDEKRGLQVRANKKVLSFPKQQEFLVSGLPGINTKMSRRLLEHFKTPERIFRANEKMLKKIHGFGNKRIKNMREILEKKYSSEARPDKPGE